MPGTEGTRKSLVAAVQAAPVFLDKKATVEKASELAAEAARNGAGLVVFPEAFIPADPDWAWVVPAGKRAMHDALYNELLENAVSVPDDTAVVTAIWFFGDRKKSENQHGPMTAVYVRVGDGFRLAHLNFSHY